MELCSMRLKCSRTHHSKVHGASEVINRMIENYLRCYCNLQEHESKEYLASGELVHSPVFTGRSHKSPLKVELDRQQKYLLPLLS